MWQFFTERGKKVIQLAHHEALRMGHPMVEPEHILLGLIYEGGGTACQAMIVLGLDLERIKSSFVNTFRILFLISSSQRTEA